MVSCGYFPGWRWRLPGVSRRSTFDVQVLTPSTTGSCLNRQFTVFELTQVGEADFPDGGKASPLARRCSSVRCFFVQQPERVQQSGVGGLGDLDALDHGMTLIGKRIQR